MTDGDATHDTKSDDLLRRAGDVLMPNYARVPDRVMARGEGSRVWDVAGREYLDLFSGFGGAILGHCHPRLAEVVCNQAKTLWHVGNQFHTKPQIGLAEEIRRRSFPGRAFFCHGGADANETAVKAARLWGGRDGGNRHEVVVLDRAFHGRTLAMISAGGNPAYREGFAPDAPGFTHVPPGDLDALATAAGDRACAVMMEPTQGEGGMHPLTPEFAQGVRQLCDDRGMLLICDEVWTGCGRTGRWFGYEHLGVVPDVFTLGKAVGGGLPTGVCWARPDVADLMQPGKHGSTLGGNPICAAAARTVFEVIGEQNLVEKAANLGEKVTAALREMPGVIAVRGHGLFLGFEGPAAGFATRALDAGLIVNQTGGGVVRLAPALTIGDAELDDGLDRLKHLLAQDA